MLLVSFKFATDKICHRDKSGKDVTSGIDNIGDAP
jgi:hypothetical protein